VEDKDGAANENLAAMLDWQRKAAELARAIDTDEEQGGGRFIALPDPFEIHEWEMMRDFAAEEVKDEDASDTLLNAIHGKGAFRYFKDKVRELGLADQWFAYRHVRYRKIALDWCEENGITPIDDAKPAAE